LTKKIFQSLLISWYKNNKRDLPWRSTKDPYIIWISEIILQQTRVEQGLPYFNRFISRFPDLKSLATADIEEVLRLWQGLGYYSRARNLHYSAKKIVQEFGGIFPDNFKKLRELKGVGDYTAAAVASISFGEKVPVVDGNVMRVISRIFGKDWDLSKSASKQKFFEFAHSIMPMEHDPSEFNQALMEFGALQCSPKSPNCDLCPMNNICFANHHVLVEQLPVKSKRQKQKEIFFNYLIIESGKKLLMRKRRESIWNGLYDFPLLENDLPTSSSQLNEAIESYLNVPSEIVEVSGEVRHLLSHLKIRSRFVKILIRKEDKEKLISATKGTFFELDQIEDLPKPKLVENYLTNHFFDLN
jgi:A/G-specific adenine glycosylase